MSLDPENPFDDTLIIKLLDKIEDLKQVIRSQDRKISILKDEIASLKDACEYWERKTKRGIK